MLCDFDRQKVNNEWVRETSFGRWFLRTHTWFNYVLTDAIENMRQLLGDDAPKNPSILDIGCGEGLSFALLEKQFSPIKITGVDIDKDLLKVAEQSVDNCSCEIQLTHSDAAYLELPSESFDIICCHQLLHHVSNQERVLEELFRLLKPGGYLMISESCKIFIESWTVRYLFKHPKNVQKTADGYINLVRSMCFYVDEQKVRRYSPWWSLKDLGLLGKLGISKKNSSEHSEVMMIAEKK